MEKKQRSRTLIVGTLFSLLYVGYAWISYFSMMNEAVNESASAAAVGAVASVLIVPHLIVALIGAIFNIIGFVKIKLGFILTAAILYSVACGLCIFWAFLLLPGMILMYVGYSKQKKILKAQV